MSNTTLAPAPSDAPETPPAAERPALSLSATALVAGAAAAVTSAVGGSHLGTAGTLGGAAIGSVIGALSSSLYTFGLERTRHALSALTPRRSKLLVGVLVTALLAFVLALGVITGFERATGASLAGRPGTTVSQAAAQSRAKAVEREAEQVDAGVAQPVPTASPTPTPTPTQAASAEPSPSTAPSTEPAQPSSEPTTAPAPASDPAPVAPVQPAPSAPAQTVGSLAGH